MIKVGNVVCKVTGATGIALAGYDALKLTKIRAKKTEQKQQADYLENIYFNSRTTENVSVVDNNIRKKSFDVLQKNPLPSFWGTVKGGFKGFFGAIENNFFLLLFSILACATKNGFAKFGAAGVGITMLVKILRDGLGVGKDNPIK